MFQNVRGLKKNELVNVHYHTIVVNLLLSGGGLQTVAGTLLLEMGTFKIWFKHF